MARLLSQTLTRSIPYPNTNPLHLLSSLRRHFSIKAELIELDLSSSDSDSADSTLKKLEDAVHGIIVRRAAPDWIHFRPGTSYWVPPRPKGTMMSRVVEIRGWGERGEEEELSEEEALCLDSVNGAPCASYFIDGLLRCSDKTEAVIDYEGTDGIMPHNPDPSATELELDPFLSSFKLHLEHLYIQIEKQKEEEELKTLGWGYVFPLPLLNNDDFTIVMTIELRRQACILETMQLSECTCSDSFNNYLQLDSSNSSVSVWQQELQCLRGVATVIPRCPLNRGPGFKEVNEDEKSWLVGNVFSNVASSYDLMNDLMSAGLHRLWKDRLVAELNPFPGMKHIDMAGGTGDVAFRILEAVNKIRHRTLVDVSQEETQIYVCDINPKMLEVGKKRAFERGFGNHASLIWVEGDAEALKFEDNTMDGYTIAFGIRNVTHIEKVLAEAYRVLKRGGRFLCLELSHVETPVFKQLYDYYSFSVIPAIGELVAADRDSYQYLVESIRRFPSQDLFASMIADAGFQKVQYENLVGGVVAIHSGLKV
ncbi:2-methoxy-6-polyprenyl-1,4-benzoquinol methylase, mitochondrial-like protein [Drosera capensis]